MNIFIYLCSLIISIQYINYVFPHGVPITFPLVIISLLFFIYQVIKCKIDLLYVLKIEIILMVLALPFLVAITQTSISYSFVLNDFKNIIISLLFVPQLAVCFRGDYKEKIISIFTWVVSTFMIFSSLFSFYKLYLLSQGILIDFLNKGKKYPWGTSLVEDYNIYSLGLIAGLFACYMIYKKSESFSIKFFYFIGTIPIIFSVILSGSRRGLIIVSLLVLFFLISKFLKLIFNFKRLMLGKFYLPHLLIKLTIIIGFFVILGQGVWKSSNNLIQNTSDGESQIEKVMYRIETLSTFKDSLEGSRGNILISGLDLYEDYNFVEKFFGKDFSYIRSISPFELEDYPHNVLVSSLLIGGAFYFFLTISFLMVSLITGYNFRDEMGIFFFIFVINFIFLLTSSNSIFSDKQILFLLFIPIIIWFNVEKNKRDHAKFL